MVAQFESNENSTNPLSTLRIDREQAFKQLELLGYSKDERVYTRSFFPAKDPRSANDRGRKGDRLNFNEKERWQREGRGVYFVVNGGGHRDEDVKLCRAIFYEHDYLPKEDQLYLWEKLGLPTPTFQVDTGGKSIHSYWVFDQLVPVEDWKVLQADLLNFSDADRAIKNPSRVMRLAGAWHISEKGAFPTMIVSSCGKRYSFEQLRGIIPTPQAEQTTPKPQSPQPKVNKQPPLQRMSPLELATSYLAALHPSRADDYQDWLYVGLALHSTGYPEALLLWDDWSKQSPKYQPGVCERKWESFRSSGVNLGTLGHMAKQDGWRSPFKSEPPTGNHFKSKSPSRNGSGGGGDDGGNIVKFPSFNLDINAIKEQIKTFLIGDYSESELIAERIKVRAENPGLSEREVKNLFDSIAEENETTKSRADTLKEVDYLLKTSDDSIKLSDYLPEELATPLNQWCKWLNIRPEVALTTVLATASSLHKVGTKLLISDSGDYEKSPNMFAAIIAESGQAKSPIFRTLAKKPLQRLKKEVNDFYSEQMKEYELARERWLNDKTEAVEKGLSYDEPEPKPPQKPAPFYFNHATGEGITTAAAANPDKTLFALIDELAGYFKSQDAYRSGKGSDKQEVLSYHDGEGKTVFRAGGVKADVDEIYLSIFGTIQPEIIKRLMGNGNDEDGQWARFFFVHQPRRPVYMSEVDAGGVNPVERLTAVYRRCFSVPKEQYRLSAEAYRLLAQFNNKIQPIATSHPKPGIRTLYGKVRGHVGVLAVNLHVLGACAIGFPPSEEISASTMARAITLMRFYLGQSRMLHADVEGELAAHLVKVIEMSKRFEDCGKDGWVSQRQVYDTKVQINGKRAKSADIRGWMKELEEMGRGTCRDSGGNLLFHYKNAVPPLIGESGELVRKEVPQPDPIYIKDSSKTGESEKSGEKFSNFEISEDSLSSKDVLVADPPPVGSEVKPENFSEKVPHFPQQSLIDHVASVSGGEEVSPALSPLGSPSPQPAEIEPTQTETASPHAPDQPAEPNNEVPTDCYPNASRTTNNAHQIAFSEAKQVESGSTEAFNQVAESPFVYPEIGWWVKVDGSLGQVTGCNEEDKTIRLDGVKIKNHVFGSYPIERCEVLTQEEILKRGLSFKL